MRSGSTTFIAVIRGRVVLFAACALWCLSAAAFAIDKEPAVPEPEQPAIAPDASEPSADKEAQPDAPSDKEVAPDAVPEQSPDDALDPLTRIIEGMRRAHERIEQRDTGTETRGVQEQVVRDIDKLIELAKQQAKSSSQQQRRQKRPSQPKPEDGQQQANRKPTASSDPGESTGRRRDRPAEDSSDTAQAGSETRERLLSPRDLVNDVWGHLPPAIREELLNVSTERVVQKYETLLKRYYESLAEQERSDEAKP